MTGADGRTVGNMEFGNILPAVSVTLTLSWIQCQRVFRISVVYSRTIRESPGKVTRALGKAHREEDHTCDATSVVVCWLNVRMT